MIHKTLLLLTGLILSNSVFAIERPIGDPVEKHGMEITAVYLQSVLMEPHSDKHGNTDVHIECDVRAIEDNNNGFGIGEWVPGILVEYKMEKIDSDWSTSGTLEPMVAFDGPHYGKNIKMDGAGKYKLTYTIKPPSESGFLRHTDRETGVGAWWETFSLSWEFVYLGVGKKGGY